MQGLELRCGTAVATLLAACCCTLAQAQAPAAGATPAATASAPAVAASETTADSTPPLEPTVPPGGLREGPEQQRGLLADIKAYYTSPLRWDVRDWGYFAGALAAVGVAHHFDSDVRTHFVEPGTGLSANHNNDDLQDAIPAAALVGGTWLYSVILDDRPGWTATWSMLEAAGLSAATSEVIAYASGRRRPYETTDPNHWFAGGNSFPSLHVTAAFAIGTVFAESGDEEHIWLTRFMGYGVAAYTGYLRLKHNDHWFSDTVAGAALGASTAVFVLHRAYPESERSGLTVTPIPGGAQLSYSTYLPY